MYVPHATITGVWPLMAAQDSMRDDSRKFAPAARHKWSRFGMCQQRPG
jgi:hypothetical protein